MEKKKKKRSKLVIILVLLAGLGLLATTFLPYLPYLFARQQINYSEENYVTKRIIILNVKQ